MYVIVTGNIRDGISMILGPFKDEHDADEYMRQSESGLDPEAHVMEVVPIE